MRAFRYLTAIGVALALCALPGAAFSQGKGHGGGGGGQAKGAEQKEQHAGPAQAAMQGRGNPAAAAQGKGRGQGATQSQVRAQPSQPPQPPQAKERGRGNERGNERALGQQRGTVAATRGNALGRAVEPPGIAIARAHGGEAKALGVRDVRGVRGGEVALPGAMPRAIAPIANSSGPFVREIVVDRVPVPLRAFVLSERPENRLAGKTVALALARGVDLGALGVAPLGNGVTIVNRSGVVLLGLDEASANNLGGWKVVTINDRVESGAPSFCRSGAGHPVWGRQWCLDKGFGLGTPSNVRWASTNLSDVVFTQPTTTQLITAAVLRQVIGPMAFDRLAAHAITLGLVDPLTATWLGQPTGGPRVLYVQSGTYPVAELVDVNRDNRPETMLVALRPW